MYILIIFCLNLYLICILTIFTFIDVFLQLYDRFQSIFHSNHKNNVNNNNSKDESQRKKTRIQLSSKTTSHLASISEYLRKPSRKYNITKKSQVITDKQLHRERNKKKKENKNKKIDDSLSLASKKSSSSKSTTSRGKTSSDSSSSQARKKNGRKEKKKDLLKQNSIKRVQKPIAINGPSLPLVIDVSKCPQEALIDEDENDIETVNSKPASSSSSQPTKSLDRTSFPPSKQRLRPSNPLRHLRPPRPPSANDAIKTALPGWLIALREKQKIKKREERTKKSSINDDDNQSVQTIDLEKMAVDAVGEHRIISIFGKRIPLSSRPKQIAQKQNIELVEDEVTSPWKIKLKSVNRKSMIGNEHVHHKSAESSISSDTFVQNPNGHNQSQWVSPYHTKSHSSEATVNNQNDYDLHGQITNCNISPGDVINLDELPESDFDPKEETIVFPITNNSDNRSQVVILGTKLLLVASRFVGTTGDVENSTKANVLWFTLRSSIVSLALNNRADGVLISIENGTSFPLDFENCNECFTFVQTYYNYNQTLPSTRNKYENSFKSPATNANNVALGGAYITPQTKSLDPFQTPIETKSTVIDDEDKPKSISASGVTMSTENTSRQDNTNHYDKEIVSKFKKMLKCGVPPDALRHKMTIEGVDMKTQDVVFEKLHIPSSNGSIIDEGTNGIKSDVTNMLENHFAEKFKVSKRVEKSNENDSEDTNRQGSKRNIASMLEGHLKKQLNLVQVPAEDKNDKLIKLTEEEEQIALKYCKMIKVGMPIDRVSHAMKRDQVSENVVFAVENQHNNESSTDTSIIWTEEEERILNKFKTMIKIKMPRDAVRNKMMIEKVDQKLIEALLGRSEQTAMKPTTLAQSNKLSTQDEADVEKYKRMLKIGLPQDAVRHAMLKDNINKALIDKFLGPDPTQEPVSTQNSSTLSVEEKSQVEKYKKMIKMGLPIGAVHHKMRQENASKNVVSAVIKDDKGSKISPSPVKKRKKLSGTVKLRWDTLTKEKAEDSIWGQSSKKPKIALTKVEFDDLREIFKEKKRVILPTNTKSNAKKMARILDINRAQNVSISLQAFKQYSLEEMVTMIQDLDPTNKIKGDRVTFLSGLLPKPEESEAIKKYTGEDKLLTPAEIFFRKLLPVPRVQPKIKVIETIEMFDQNVKDITFQFDVLNSTCNEVMHSDKLQKVLDSVLTIGNIMNEGTRTGDAVGIKFDSLLKLTQTKSKDKTMSVLDYIVMIFTKRDERHILKLSKEFPQCATASRIHITDVVSNFTSLESSLKSCKVEFTKMKNDQLSQGKQFSPGLLRLEQFMASSEDALSQLKISREKASTACKVSQNYNSSSLLFFPT